MIDIKLEEELKKYLDNLDLTIIINPTKIKRLAKTIFYLMKEIHLYKDDQQKLKKIKWIIFNITNSYFYKDKNISFIFDIKSDFINENIPYANNAYAFIKNKNEKFMLLQFYDEKQTNLKQLSLFISEFLQKMKNTQNMKVIPSSFLKKYFHYLKQNDLKNSLDAIENFLEIYLQYQIKKYLSYRYIEINKLNIFHI